MKSFQKSNHICDLIKKNSIHMMISYCIHLHLTDWLLLRLIPLFEQVISDQDLFFNKDKKIQDFRQTEKNAIYMFINKTGCSKIVAKNPAHNNTKAQEASNWMQNHSYKQCHNKNKI